jgi:hypothetical protein
MRVDIAFERLCACGAIGHVEGEDTGLAAQGENFIAYGLCLFDAAAAMQDQVMTGPCQRQGDGTAYAAAGSGDKNSA